MNEELNKRIHEILGMCWHDWVFQDTVEAGFKGDFFICAKCKEEGYYEEPFKIDFTTSWEGFGILWEFLQKHKDWERCPIWVLSRHDEEQAIPIKYISPLALTQATVEFFKGEHK